ncbi:TAXI family TRAP transporter solute-binding subunit [Halomonas salipaludis]|uniref:C4-dicarboxylate ABC transporter substrate-binding protein n=1 Tax=Halomonas salipaludis TaxID=2032625 RepID=A0A2A2EN34_9GAMM|nr:TAXI family TRAP transporter solute-binding subunit [Halomonas salipaludis]PAU74821.1 C4-dicarboxylate ABC transporter substrate-binding protein [Halomonas salipaludis]
MHNKTAQLAAAVSAITLGLTVTGQAMAADNYRLSTLEPGSSSYMIMSTFAQMVNSDEDLDVNIQVNATGAATQHALEAGIGDIDFFMWSASVHDSMKQGINMYAPIPHAQERSENVRGVMAFPQGFYHFITDADSGIESLEDLAGHRVFLGPPGGGATVVMRQTIEAATGLVANEDYEAVNLGWNAATQAYQDGRLDVYINPTLPPSPTIEQFALSREIRLLGLTEEQMEKPEMVSIVNRPGGVTGTIDPDDYGENVVNQEPVLTLGSISGIGTGKHLSADEVYAITKSFWEQAEEQRERTPWLRHVRLETAIEHLNLPLHPGAERYYREVGLEIPDELVAQD